MSNFQKIKTYLKQSNRFQTQQNTQMLLHFETNYKFCTILQKNKTILKNWLTKIYRIYSRYLLNQFDIIFGKGVLNQKEKLKITGDLFRSIISNFKNLAIRLPSNLSHQHWRLWKITLRPNLLHLYTISQRNIDESSIR